MWDAEETNVFKTVLQSIPLGASASVICNKVHATLREQGLVKTPDQVPILPRHLEYHYYMYMVSWQGSNWLWHSCLNFPLQVQTKYYRLLKALVDHLGKRMPPKPYKQAGIQSALLAHWDKVTINTASYDHVMLVLQSLCLNTIEPTGRWPHLHVCLL